MGRRVEGNSSPPLCLDVLKLVRGKGVISHFSYLDVLKIRMKKRGNDLNRQIYPYLIFFKIKIFLHSLTNQTENKEHSNH